jgi:hypothetical protein
MAEPKKETVRIALPPRPDKLQPSASAEKPDTARIVLPSRTPVAPLRRLPPKITPLPDPASTTEPATISLHRPPVAPPQSSTASPLLQPLPKPPGLDPTDESREARTSLPAVSQTNPAPSIYAGPKKETARISILPRPVPAPAPAVNMTKTQPLLIRPAAGVQPVPVIIAPKPADIFDSIPRPYCWALFGIAALIFLIQILNYVVS